jgi:hypothetical protein|tara:strand:+ start:3119 stop:3709 length:591 start_codon:yes stop_codon:yes gene_type:complete
MKKIFIIIFFINFSSYSQTNLSVGEYTELLHWSDRLTDIRVPVISQDWMNVLKTDRFTYYTELRQWSDRIKKLKLPVVKKSEINSKKNIKKGLGFSYQGLGIYTLGKKGKLRTNTKYYVKDISDLKKNTINELEKFTEQNNYKHEILSIENSVDVYDYTHIQETYSKVLITFKVFNKDGMPVLNKYDNNYKSMNGK